MIKFCAGAGMTPTEIWNFICKSKQARPCSRSIVFDWHKPFCDRRVSIHDEKRMEDLLSIKTVA